MARQDATTIRRPVRVFDFAAFSRTRPTQQVPGDRLDAQFAAHADAINAIVNALEGLKAPLTVDRLDPSLLDSLTAKISQTVRLDATDAESAAGSAVSDALEARRAAFEAQVAASLAANTARAVADSHQTAIDTVRRLAAEVADAQAAYLHAVEVPPNAPLEGPNQIRIDSGGWYATDVAGATATSADYAEVAINWAEYMPWTIPPNILAINAITGDHWSSRWWAHRAGEFVGGFLNGYYMGPFPTPPTMSLTGGPILLGALYFNTTDNVMYVWNGTAWIPFHTPQAAATGSFFYQAVAGQTVFDLTVADLFGNLLPAPLDPAEGIEVHFNGVRLTPWSATVDGDYEVDVPASSVILQEPAQAGSLVAIDVLMDKAKLAPAFVAIEKLRPFPVDGTTTTFPLIDSLGVQLTLLDASQLHIILDGVTQEPGRDYALDVTGQNVVFLVAPSADTNVFTIWYSNSLIGAGGSIVVVHDSTLRGQGTVPQPLGVVEATATQQGAVHVPAGSALTIAVDGALGMLVANAGQVATGTNNTFPITPQRLRGVMGDDVANLNTTAKTVVPAINEIVGVLSGAQQLIGNMDASTGLCVFDPRWGIPNGLLPAATGADGKYVIVTVSGTPPAGPPETRIPAVIGDWFISTGAIWLHLAVGNATATAGAVSLNPFVFGQDNVQDALEEAEAIVADAPFLPLSAGLGFPLTGGLFGTNAQFQNGVFTNLGVTGVLTVTGPNSLLLSAAAGQQRAILGGTLNTVRWQMSLGDIAPETGGNAGSNFEINAFSDAGGPIVRALHIERATGFVSVANDPTQPLQVATKRYVDLVRGLVPTDPTPPPNPQPGQLWWRSDPDGELYVYYDDGDSLQWVPASPTNTGGGGPGGGQETDPLSLHLTGGTMTGPLMLAQDPVDPTEAVTKAYADALATGVVDNTTYFVNRTPGGSTSGDLNTITQIGAYNIAGTNFANSANRPPLGTNGGNANTNTLILHVFRSGSYAIQEAYEGPDDITGNNSYPIYTKWMRNRGGGAAAWSAWVQQPLNMAAGGNFLPLAGGLMTGTIQSNTVNAALEQIGSGQLQVGLRMMSTVAPGGAFSLTYQANDNERFRVSHTTSGVPTTTHRIEIEGAAGPINLNGVAQVARAPTAPQDIVNKAYADTVTGVASGAWTALTISGGFTSTDLQARTIPGGRFEMRGSILRTAAWTVQNTLVSSATLPVGMRPPSPDRRFLVPLSINSTYLSVMAQIQPSGMIAVSLPTGVADGNTGRFYFDNVSLGST